MIYVRYAKLITVLLFASMFLILAYLVISVTSCSLPSPQSQRGVGVRRTTGTPIPRDGTIYHPYSVDATPYGNVDTWDVLTVHGHEKWRESETLYVIRPGDYISYQGQEYHISGINYKALTMTAHILGK